MLCLVDSPLVGFLVLVFSPQTQSVENSFIRFLMIVILHKLYLDMVPSSSEDITRAMRGQLKSLCRNYLGRNGENVIVCFNFVS